MEFARGKKETLIDHWHTSQKVETKEQLILLEGLKKKKSVPEVVSICLSEQKAKTVEDTAVLADEYVLAHKATVRLAAGSTLRLRLMQLQRSRLQGQVSSGSSTPYASTNKISHSKKLGLDRICFYCKKPGHIVLTALF